MKKEKESAEELSGRLRAIMNHYDLSVNQIAERVGGSQVKFYNLLNGTSKPDFKTTESILSQFPDISAEWFMRGGGSMLRTPPATLSAELTAELDERRKKNELLQDMFIKMARTEARAQVAGKSKVAFKSPGAYDLKRERIRSYQQTRNIHRTKCRNAGMQPVFSPFAAV